MALVRGIQLGLGLGLIKKGLGDGYSFVHSREISVESGRFVVTLLDEIQWIGLDSVLISVVLAVVSMALYKSRRFPVALLLFVYGLLIAIIQYFEHSTDESPSLTFGPDSITVLHPSWNDVYTAFLYMTLPQLPLTLLNSIVALVVLSSDLFPSESASITRTSLSLSFANIILCWFGAVPSCHGCGGLASQYAFGARSNVSMMFLGIVKVVLALSFGSSLIVLLQDGIFPSSVLGVMLIFSGLNLAIIARDIVELDDAIIMIVTASTTLSLKSGVGYLCGIATSILLRLFS